MSIPGTAPAAPPPRRGWSRWAASSFECGETLSPAVAAAVPAAYDADLGLLDLRRYLDWAPCRR
jgi:hypothetical protein